MPKAKLTFITADKKKEFILPIAVALIMDALDYLLAPLFLLPGYGDIFDAIGIAILFKFVGPVALAGAFEFIPIEDPMPTYTLIVLAAFAYKLKNRLLK